MNDLGSWRRVNRLARAAFLRNEPRSFAAALVLLACLNQATWGQATPVGLWRTISDADGKPTALVEIREVDGQLTGIVKAVLVEGEADRVCANCPGDRKGQRIAGMEILRRMRPDGDGWGGGEILDPDVGKVYRANMHLEDDGKKLKVRGYIGFSPVRPVANVVSCRFRRLAPGWGRAPPAADITFS